MAPPPDPDDFGSEPGTHQIKSVILMTSLSSQICLVSQNALFLWSEFKYFNYIIYIWYNICYEENHFLKWSHFNFRV